MQKEIAFLGRGAAYSENHNCGIFENDDCFVILDCPMSAATKLYQRDFNGKRPYILITHTHGDHIGGVGMFAFICNFTKNVKPVVIAPSKNILNNLKTYLKIENVADELYDIVCADELGKDFLIKTIRTEHIGSMGDLEAYGYQLKVNGENVIYTGDTNTLQPFLPYLQEGSRLYTEIAVKSSEKAHLRLDKAKPLIEDLVSKGVKIYFMHIDDEAELKRQMKGIDGVELAPLVDMNKQTIRTFI